MSNEQLIKYAIKVRENASAPSSKFKGGACFFAKSGKICGGCNVENSAFGATNCAERTALFSAVANGEREFEKIAIIGSNPDNYAYPCGVCRQVLSEFGDLKVIVAKNENDYKEFKLSDLLPHSFNKDSM